MAPDRNLADVHGNVPPVSHHVTYMVPSRLISQSQAHTRTRSSTIGSLTLPNFLVSRPGTSNIDAKQAARLRKSSNPALSSRGRSNSSTRAMDPTPPGDPLLNCNGFALLTLMRQGLNGVDRQLYQALQIFNLTVIISRERVSLSLHLTYSV